MKVFETYRSRENYKSTKNVGKNKLTISLKARKKCLRIACNVNCSLSQLRFIVKCDNYIAANSLKLTITLKARKKCLRIACKCKF